VVAWSQPRARNRCGWLVAAPRSVSEVSGCVARGGTTAGFKLGLMRKDVTIAVDNVCKSAPAGGLLPHVKRLLDEAVETQGAESDYTRVVRLLEARAGIELHSTPPPPDAAAAAAAAAVPSMGGSSARYHAPAYDEGSALGNSEAKRQKT
jgi:hypothetical protein